MASPAVSVSTQILAPGWTKPSRPSVSACGGFTLLELLVVLVIVGVMLGAITLNLDPGQTQLQQDAQRIAQLMQLARDEAIVRNQPIAFESDTMGYRFLVQQEHGWVALTGDALLRERQYRITPIRLWLDASAAKEAPLRIVFGREPVDKAFTLTLATHQSQVSIRADGIGNFDTH